MRDEVIPEDNWEFDEEVAAVFDNMLERSIPDYRKMREAVNAIAAPWLVNYQNENAFYIDSEKAFHGPDVHIQDVLDVGCSNGLALKGLDDYAKANNHTITRLVGTDISEPMLNRALELGENDDRYRFYFHDLRDHLAFEDESFDVVLCVLTLQFTPVVHRLRILDELYRVLKPQGRLVLVEKLEGDTQQLNEEMIHIYHNHKRSMGYSEEQIERKRLSLEGVMTPITEEWNEYLLEHSGFTHRECFWRWMNFAGWVGIK